MNEQVLSLLRSRRSSALRTLSAPGPSDAEIDSLLALSARVPDHGKLVPWRFIVIAGEGRRRLEGVIADAFAAGQSAGGDKGPPREGNWLGPAPLTIAVISSPREHPKIPEWEQTLSAGAVCMSMLVAAKAMGYGAVWLTEWYAYDRRVLAALGLAPHERLAGFMHLGTEPSPREDRPRPVMADIVTHFTG
ncbi:MAG: nitroreductase [Phycisphaeraceae bacterium]|nr:nitroreductase [Phycisphaeraceae bacterium]